MTPPAALIDQMIRAGDSANTVARVLREAGYEVSLSAISTRVSQLIASGERQAQDRGGFAAVDVVRPVSEQANARACRALLEAHLRTGFHWLRDEAHVRKALAA